MMRSCRIIAVVALVALALSGVRADEEPTFDLLFELEPSYNVLNVTGWSSYPDCWVFPQPAIALVSEETTWQVAFLSDASDTSAGLNVANAWCRRWGLDKAGEFRQSDYSDGKVVRSLSVGSGETCAGVSPTGCTSFKYIECVRGTSETGCGRVQSNNGIDNVGFGNVGASNIGNFNEGSSNVGDFNLGSANVGSFNDGSAVTGSFQACSACTAPDLVTP